MVDAEAKISSFSQIRFWERKSILKEPRTPKHHSCGSTVMASTSYDVFLSFRGEDTRDNFTGYLYAELCKNKIETFIDNELKKGDEISPELYKAIEDSTIYVIIFSENYASSSWCLDELAKILECKKSYGRDVIPVFYKMDPSSVRHQKGSYADAFVNHKKRFEDKLTRWKVALAEAAGISGWDSKTIRPEYRLVDGIVEDILRKLDRSCSSYNEGLVGVDEHIAQIQSLLQLESARVRTLGIWGMGGIGKTTLARALYDILGTQFSSRSLVENAQQEIDRDGTRGLRQKYLSELGFSDERLKRAKVLLILDDVKDSSQIQDLIGGRGNFGQGSRIIVTSRDKQVLRNADADEIHEVKKMNDQNSLKLFSLNAFKQNYHVEVNADLVEKVLKYANGIPIALKILGTLLCGRAENEWKSQLEKLEKFPNRDISDVLKLSYDGLDDEQKDIFLDIACYYVGYGVDEAMEMLDVFGFSTDIGMAVLKDRGLISILKNRIVMHDLIWEMGREIVRQQCIRDPEKRSRLWDDKEIYHVLRKSKGTDVIQCIFLDMSKIKEVQLHHEIFKSMPNLRMLYFRKGFYFAQGQSSVTFSAFLESFPDGLKFLHWDGFPQKSLPVDFYAENLVKLNMCHSHLEQLWDDDQELPNLERLDLRNSLKLIRIPDLSKLPKIEEILLSGCESLIQVYSSSFLSKLKCLWLNGCVELTSLNLHSNILSRSSGLVGLYNCCKLKTFSMNIMDELESCGGSCFNDANPKGTSSYQGMNGRGLEETYLKDLKFFREIFTPSRYSHELCWLDLDSCKSLTSLPTDLFKLKSLRRLHLSGCCNLEKIPEIQETMENLVELVLDGTKIQKLPSSLDRLVGLEELSLRGCKRLEIIPSSIGRLTKLWTLDLSFCELLETFPSSIFKLKLIVFDLTGCSLLNTLPEILEPAESFICLKLDLTPIRVLPSSLHHLVGLEELSLYKCRRLEMIPSSIGRLTRLCNLNLTYCESLETFPSSIFKLNLTQLDLDGCPMLKTFPEILDPTESFTCIDLKGTTIKELPSSLDFLVGLQTLHLNWCRDLESLPNSICNLKFLSELDCLGCRNLTEIPNDIGRLSSLRNLLLQNTGIVNLPESVGYLSSLKSLDVSYTGIVYLPESVGYLSSLKSLDVSYTGIVNLPESVAHLSSLKSLNVSYTGIVNLPKSIAHLSSLKSLEVSGCRKLECIPQLPPSLKELFAFNCPSITRVMPNSILNHPSDSIKGTFRFHFTTDEDQDPIACSDVVADARLRISEDAYRIVFYCFPGSGVPDWFPYRSEGDSVTVDQDSLNWCNDNRLIGFAMCFVLRHEDTGSGNIRIRCSITFKSDGRTFTFSQDDQLKNIFYWRAGRMGQRDHTFLWKTYLKDSVEEEIFHASSFNFEITSRGPPKSSYEVKECGIYPLYNKEKYDFGDLVDMVLYKTKKRYTNPWWFGCKET